jgi:hypothetical protein
MARGDSQTTRQVAPSLDHMQKYTRSGVQLVIPSEHGRRTCFSEAVKKEENKRYRITMTPKDGALSQEHIKNQLKRNINPTDIKVGITAIRTVRERRTLIEMGSEEEMNTLSPEIDTKLGERLEITRHRLRKPRLITYNVPEEITTQNVATIIKAQNPKIQSNGEGIEAKYKFKDRKGRHNIVMDVGPQIRLQILQIKLKIGWEICNVSDCLAPTRCYKCSRYNHKHYECKGEETCPRRTGKHKMKECTAAASEQKSNNCITCNRYNKKERTNENHSAPNKNCPSLQTVIASTGTTWNTNMEGLRSKNNLGIFTMNRKQVRYIQINLQHSRSTTDNLVKKIDAEEPDLICIQEPYEYRNRITRIDKQHRIFTEGTGKHRAAIIIRNSNIHAIFITKLSHEDTVLVEIIHEKWEFFAASMYFDLEDQIENNFNKMDELMQFVKGGRILITVDSNSRSKMWHDFKTNSRGRKLEEYPVNRHLHIIKDES